jgi:hypothetical protein
MEFPAEDQLKSFSSEAKSICYHHTRSFLKRGAILIRYKPPSRARFSYRFLSYMPYWQWRCLLAVVEYLLLTARSSHDHGASRPLMR